MHNLYLYKKIIFLILLTASLMNFSLMINERMNIHQIDENHKSISRDILDLNLFQNNINQNFVNQLDFMSSVPDNQILELNSGESDLIFDTIWGESFLGGSETEVIDQMMLDNAGNLYLIGQTGSADFPLENAFDSTHNAYYIIDQISHRTNRMAVRS